MVLKNHSLNSHNWLGVKKNIYHSKGKLGKSFIPSRGFKQQLERKEFSSKVHSA